MGAACAALTARVSHRSSPTARTAYRPQCYFLSAAYRRCVALLTARMAALADGVSLLPPLAAGWNLGTDPYDTAAAGTPAPGSTSPAQCGLGGQPIGEDHRRRRSARL